MDEKIKVWYDPEGDFLEIIFRSAPGVFEDTDLDQVMKKVDEDGRVIAYSIIGVSTLRGSPFELSVPATSTS
jgi:uncharacterized protein YuzE